MTLSGFLSALSGLGGSADAPFSAADYNFLNKVWGYIRVAANWTDINWADGYLSKQGAVGGRPPISDEAYAIMNDLWGQIRVAANFGDINWAAHGYAFTPALPAPAAAAAPIPEITPLQPTQLVPYPSGADTSILTDLMSLFTGQQTSPVYSTSTRLAPGSGSPDGSTKPTVDPVLVSSQKQTMLIVGGIGAAVVLGALLMGKKKGR